MTKPPEKTTSTAPRPIAPPPLSQHLRELASRPGTWQVIARNLIPVVGIYGFGWSAALAGFHYWFGGLTGIAAIVAAVSARGSRRVQLLGRRTDGHCRNRCRADSARAARDAAEIGWRDMGGERCARRVHLDFPRRHYRSALLDRADSAPRSAARRRTAPRALAFSGALVRFRLARSRTFLEGVPSGLRRYARQRAEAAGALGCLSPDTARDGDVHHGRPRSRFHSSAAVGAAAELFRDLARARARRGLRRSVAALRIRPGRSCVEPAPTLTAAGA